MKKFLSVLLAFCMIVTSMVFVPLTVTAEGASSTNVIYVSESGSDSNPGTQSAPVATVKQAITLVEDGGYIFVIGTVTPANNDSFAGSKLNKSVTITSDGTGTIDFTGVQFVQLKNNTTFENIYLKFTQGYYLFGCGYDFIIRETVKFAEGSGSPCVFAGAYQASCGSTNVQIFAGTYTSIHGASHDNGFDVNGDTNVVIGGTASANNIYGAGSNSDVSGNTYVWIGGNANAGCDPSSHSGTYNVYGGGNNSIVGGSTHVVFTENAKANYIFGGGVGAKSSIATSSNITMSGGNTMSMYGGSNGVQQNCDANVTLSGGTLEQVFGGCQNASLIGDVTVKLLGGTVKRRVFGGCYNNAEVDVVSIIPFKIEVNFTSSYSVLGNTTLVIDDAFNIDFSYKDPQYGSFAIVNDHSFSAHSRRKSADSNEKATVIYVNKGSMEKFEKVLTDGPNVEGGSHETTHLYTYNLSGNTIIQECSVHKDHSATCEFVVPTDAVYNGKEHTVQITDESYSDNWEFEKFAVNYSDNINAGEGEASARFTIEGVAEVTYNFDIAKASKSAPSIKISNGQVVGITEEMEYSVDGRNYVPYVNGTALSGKIFVRYKETDNTKASNAVKVYANIDMAVNAVEGRAGYTVEVVVYTPYFDGGVSSLTVGYDHDALELVSATNGDVLSGIALNDDVLTFENATQKSKQGTFVKLSFRIKDGAKGTYEVSISGDGIDAQSGSVAVVEFVRGDVAIAGEDSDGKIDTFDILALREAVVNESTDGVALGADVDGDGNVDSKDVILLCQYLAYYDFEAGESTVTLGANSAE